MQAVGAQLLAVLESDEYDLVDLYEFYSYEETDLTPGKAALRICSTALYHNGHAYQQYALERGAISRYVDGRFNTVSLMLSNVDRAMSSFALLQMEGMRVIVRTISRRVDDDSLVLMVGRAEKPEEISNETLSISIKQDLGSIENDLPWRTFGGKCQVAGGFKGVECLAGEAPGAKSAAWQAATTCNLSWQQCNAYANLEAAQLFRFNGASANFKVKRKFLKIFPRRAATKQWSAQDDMPWGQSIPLGFGRTQIELTSIVSADTGQYLAGQSVVGEGEITDLFNVRNTTDGWATTFQAYAEHLGKYGTDASQLPVGFFASAGDMHSHTAYIEYTIKGENPDTGDAAPVLVAVVLWTKIPFWNGSAFAGLEWSDNPVEILRYIMTEARSLNYNAAWFDTPVWGAAAEHCAEAMLDQTGNEDFYASTTTGGAGTDYKRFRSTGLLDTFHFRKVLGIDSAYPASREVAYNTFNPASPAGVTSVTTWYRRRYTANFHLKEKVRVADFIFKTLLPSFKGYLVTGANGKLQLRIDKPVTNQLTRGSSIVGATTIAIEDAAIWKAQSLSVYFALVGALNVNQEVVRVASIDYSTAGNAITLAASITGTITATPSGGTLSGGSTSVQASGTVTIGGTITAGNTVTITIDGVAAAYTINANDTTGTVAGMLATIINANTTLNRFCKAEWSTASPTVVTIKSKLGTLNLAAGALKTHSISEPVIQVHMPFADHAQDTLTRSNIFKNSFKWPHGGKSTSYNQFVLTYRDAVQDFQETEVRENDYVHQQRVNKINKMDIDGSVIDNYHQADRILQSARYKYRDGDMFFSWGSTGLPLLLEEGDVVCATHDNYPARDYQLVRLEEVKISPKHEVTLSSRLYHENQYPTAPVEKTVPLTSGIGWPTAAPGAATSITLSEPSSGTVRGTFTFADYVGGQYAKIEVKRFGGSFVDSGLIVKPDASGNGQFEVSGLPAGTTEFRIVSWNSLSSASSTSSVGSISVTGVGQLQVTETDAAPSVTPTDKLIFHADSITDEGGGDASYKPVVAVQFVIDGGGAAITTGQKGHVTIPFACTILEWTLLADQSGSVVVDIWKDTFGNFPPVVADTITASAKPTLSSAQKNQSSTLTGWTTAIAAGDTLAFNVDSVATVQRVVLSLKCRRS